MPAIGAPYANEAGKQPMTEADFMALDGVRAEWIEGVTYFMSPVSVDHEMLRGLLYRLMSDLAELAGEGVVLCEPFAVKLPNDQIRLPDIAYVSPANLYRLEKTRFVGGPDLVIEIISPESRHRDLKDKLFDYDTAGVVEYWIVDPEMKRFELHRRSGSEGLVYVDPADGRCTSTVLPRFLFDEKWLTWPLPRKADLLAEMLR